MSANREVYQEDSRQEVLQRTPLLRAVIEAKPSPDNQPWPPEVADQIGPLTEDFREVSPDGWVVFKSSASRMFEPYMFARGTTAKTREEAGSLIGLLGYEEKEAAAFESEIMGSLLRLGIFNKGVMYDPSPQRREAMATAVGRMIGLGDDMRQFVTGRKEARRNTSSNISQIAEYQQKEDFYQQTGTGDK